MTLLLVIFIIVPLSQFILFGLFHILKLYNIALYFFASEDAPLFGLNKKRIASYCYKHCPNKRCQNCILWTCDNYMKGIDKK